MGDQNPVKTTAADKMAAPPQSRATRTWLTPERQQSRARVRTAMDRFWADYYKDAVK